MGDRVLVFGAHVDDEIIGVGGTVSRLSAEGAETLVVTFTGGEQETGYARPEWRGRIAEMRRQEAEMTNKILGIRHRVFLGLPTQGVTDDRETYQRCVKLIRDFRPTTIFTHQPGDKHRDHRAVSAVTEEAWWKAAENVLADLGRPWRAPKLYRYETTDLISRPSHVFDITGTLEKKLEAMRAQRSQLEVLPGILNYIRGLAMARGFLIGTEYGEAFLASSFMPTETI